MIAKRRWRERRAWHVVRVVMIAVALAIFGAVASPFLLRQHVVVHIAGARDMEIFAEVSDTALTRYVGLMFRSRLRRDEGMLFRYREARPRTFWMKNTRIPLDMIFIGPDLRVVSIVEAVPCRADPCPHYRSKGPAQFVLEVNRGLCRTFGVGPGADVEFRPGNGRGK